MVDAGDSQEPYCEEEAHRSSPRTSIRRAGRRVDTFAILAHQEAAKSAAAARHAQTQLSAERLQAVAEPTVGSAKGATHVTQGDRPHSSCLQKPPGSRLGQSAELSSAAVTKQPQRAAAVTAAKSTADINLVMRQGALSQPQATAGACIRQAPGFQNKQNISCPEWFSTTLLDLVRKPCCYRDILAILASDVSRL